MHPGLAIPMLKQTLRSLRSGGRVTAVAVLALALEIGANTAVFSVVNAVSLRPLPSPDARPAGHRIHGRSVQEQICVEEEEMHLLCGHAQFDEAGCRGPELVYSNRIVVEEKRLHSARDEILRRCFAGGRRLIDGNPATEQPMRRPRATDQEIRKWISRQHGFVPESAWEDPSM